MAFAQVTTVCNTTTDANFRAYVAMFRTQLAAMGLVQTADTGQIDPTTVAHPTSGGQIMGYDMWQFNDALQATVPVFLKFEYGYAPSGSSVPNIWITVGYATDGAGNITGVQKSTRRSAISYNATSPSTSAVFNCIFSGSSNRICAAIFTDLSDSKGTHWFAVERSKDSSGADTASGVIVGIGDGNGGLSRLWQFVPATGGVPAVESGIPAAMTNQSTFSFGTTVGGSLGIPMAGSPQNPGLNVVLHLSADFVRDSTPTFTVYGASHTYYIVGPNVTSLIRNGGSTISDSRLALRYE